jgi:hypothetical protein
MTVIIDDADFEEALEPYGWELILDLHGCDPEMLESPHLLDQFVQRLISLLDMKAYGPFECPHFGHADTKTAGYSFKQWIETSSIIGHLSPARRSVHLNIFSCKRFDFEGAALYCITVFSAAHADRRVEVRN